VLWSYASIQHPLPDPPLALHASLLANARSFSPQVRVAPESVHPQRSREHSSLAAAQWLTLQRVVLPGQRLLGLAQALAMVLWSLGKLGHHPGEQVPPRCPCVSSSSVSHPAAGMVCGTVAHNTQARTDLRCDAMDAAVDGVRACDGCHR